MTTALIYDPIYLMHDTGHHPENADRLSSTMQAVSDYGLIEKLRMLEPTAATVEEIAMVHAPSYIDHVRRVAESGGGFLDPDTYDSPHSYEAALKAAGGATVAMDKVLAGEVTNAFALVRPPGHHSLASRSMGFCLFNNIAIATRLAQARHGLARILIVDFDVHHGNGTQATFWRDKEVLYFSTHEYPFYPGSGGFDEIGEDEGRGYTINVPLPGGAGDREYLRALSEVLLPAARRFRPELIAVSAGYDTHWADPIGGMQMTVAGFGQMTKQLARLAEELCDGRLMMVLEGGYNPRALSLSVVATLDALMGESFTDPMGPPSLPYSRSQPNIASLLQRVKAIHGLI